MNTLAELMLQNTLVAAAVALLVAVGSRLWRRPAVAHFLWALVLLKLLTPPLVTIPIEPFCTTDAAGPVASVGNEAEALLIVPADELTETTFPYEITGNEPAVEGPQGTLSTVPALAWFLGLSLAGSIGYFVILGIRVRQFAGLLRNARTAPAAVAARSKRLCRAIGLRRCPTIQLVPGHVPPSVWGWGGRARILMPAGLFERLDARAQDTLLIHELAHLRRRDHWIRLLEIVATGLYWWNPVVWFARRELHEAEEQCCDRQVLKAFPGASRTYASALIDTVDFLSGARFAVPPAASAAGPTRFLRRRIEMVMRGTDLRSWSWMSRLAVGGAAMLLLPLGATWADGPEKGEKAQTKQKVVVVEAKSGSVVGEGILVVTAPDSKGKSSAAVGHTKPGKVESRVITVTTKGNGKKIGQLHIPLNVQKANTRKLKAAGRPKSVTIAYADGSKETIGLGDCDLLTLDVTAGTVSLAKHSKVFTTFSKAPHVQIQTKGKTTTQSVPGATKSHVTTGTVVKEHKVHVKKGTGGIEDRLARLEQTLLKLQQEIKALKNK